MTAILGLPFTGCKDKTENEEATFSKLTVEQNKDNMVKEGDKLMEQMDGLKNAEAVFAIQDLVSLISNSSQNLNSALKPIQSIAYIGNLNHNTKSLYKLRSTNAEFVTFNSSFNENTGIYTYNKTTGEFVKSNSTTEITYKFPTGDSQTNNATLTFYNFKSKTATNPDLDGNELLQSLDISLKNGSTSLLSFEVRGEYNSDNVPTLLSEKLTLSDTYVVSNNLTNNSTKITYDFSFKKSTTNLISAHYESKGSYNYSNLSNLGNIENEEAVSEYLSYANAWIQIANMKVQGVMDYEGLNDKMTKTFPDGMQPTEENSKKQVEILNQYVNLYLKYADTDEIIAKNTFYTITQSGGYGQQDMYSWSSKFVFKDGSSMDQSFFQEGFDSFIENYNVFMTDMENSYSAN